MGPLGAWAARVTFVEVLAILMALTSTASEGYRTYRTVRRSGRRDWRPAHRIDRRTGEVRYRLGKSARYQSHRRRYSAQTGKRLRYDSKTGKRKRY